MSYSREEYPHTLTYMITEGGGTNPETGNPIPADISWSEPLPCLYEGNGRGATRAMPDMSVVTYSFDVYLPVLPSPVKHGTKIRLYDQFGEKRYELSCKGYESYQEHSRLWL